VENGRFEAFSDGVFAVAITLLALNLAVPGPGHGLLGQQLAGRWPGFAAYVVSFLTIGIIWVNHHALVRNFADIDRPLMFLNLLLLLFVVTIPFATAMIADYLTRGGPDASLAAAIYAGVFLGMSLSFGSVFWWSIRRSHLRMPLSGARAVWAQVRFAGGDIVYAAAIGIAYLSAPASFLVCALVAVYYVFEQTPAASRAGPSRGHRAPLVHGPAAARRTRPDPYRRAQRGTQQSRRVLPAHRSRVRASPRGPVRSPRAPQR
jgi:uncharacterized membrane protein